MSEILVKNGYVYDPKNGVNGDVMDIAIRDDKIVDKVSPNAKVIDASGKVVMAGGIDIHAHVAGPKVNVGRNLRPRISCLIPQSAANLRARVAGSQFRLCLRPVTYIRVWATPR